MWKYGDCMHSTNVLGAIYTHRHGDTYAHWDIWPYIRHLLLPLTHNFDNDNQFIVLIIALNRMYISTPPMVMIQSCL